MNKQGLIQLLEDVKTGVVDIDSAVSHLKTAPFEELGYAKVDHHRGVRQGANEVIYNGTVKLDTKRENHREF